MIVEKLWAWMSIDPADGTEGIVAMLEDGFWKPFVTADPNLVVRLGRRVRDLATAEGRVVRLVEFQRVRELEVIGKPT